MIVKVDALFSHNNLIGSKIIAKTTAHLVPEIKDTPSHVALLVNNRWVHESTGKSGVHVISYDLWSNMHTEVGRVCLPPREYQEVADHYRVIKDKKYDYLGVIYLGLFIPPTFVGCKIPKKNLLESSNKYFCCEALAALTDNYYSMSAPVQILKSLKDQYEHP